MDNIVQLTKQFRRAIDIAKEQGDFEDDIVFKIFPKGCCGDTSDLLGEFLLKNGIRTYYVCGTYKKRGFVTAQTHAWLLTDDKIIIDITGDQFKYNPLFLNYNIASYVGPTDDFHKLFSVQKENVHESTGLSALDSMTFSRLSNLYKKIIQYISQ